ncbi:NEDD4-binding protein 1 [Copidosoma floridanum]|uniref:NEDD4-binding protein 1 n=1 Tax=Copidosoma floridanum TaxID=29053 RepID=UPI0006C9A71B|nr:NEDD4-binding protein 1 [Copidosoma floridanum]
MGQRRSKKSSAYGKAFVQKSPTNKVLRRSARNVTKTVHPLASYDSPLRHISHNGLISSPSSSSTSTISLNQEVVKEDAKEKPSHEVDKENSDDEVSFSDLTFDFLCSEVKKDEKQEVVGDGEKEEDEDMSDNSVQDCQQDKAVKTKKKKSLLTRILSGEKPNCLKKKKFNKSLLSRIRDPDETIDSVIFVDDSDSEKSPEKSLLHKSTQNTDANEPVPEPSSSKHLNEFSIQEISDSSCTTPNVTQLSRSDAVTNLKDVVVVQESDSFLMEMESYHNKFSQSTNNQPNQPVETESIIILDPDDEPQEEEDETEEKEPVLEHSTKMSEDCLVVWSSLPESRKSTEPTCKPQCSFDSNADILKQDKILIDTSPNVSNYMFLNNENNKPKKKFMKSPKIMRGAKKSPLKYMLEKTKAIANNTAKSAAQAAKIAEKSRKDGEEKFIIKKDKTKTMKRKAKVNEDLIFISHSKDDGEAETKKKSKKGKLREIVIDGSNIGMAYTQSKFFSEKGIKLTIDYFAKKGHVVKVFIPQHRRSRNCPLLEEWYKDGTVVFTPSRKIGNKSFTPYDDRYILEYALTCGGIVVSQDQFRDLYAEKPQYRDIIENRLLVPTFVGDYVMFPEDPLGRNGPTLANFLRH